LKSSSSAEGPRGCLYQWSLTSPRCRCPVRAPTCFAAAQTGRIPGPGWSPRRRRGAARQRGIPQPGAHMVLRTESSWEGIRTAKLECRRRRDQSSSLAVEGAPSQLTCVYLRRWGSRRRHPLHIKYHRRPLQTDTRLHHSGDGSASQRRHRSHSPWIQYTHLAQGMDTQPPTPPFEPRPKLLLLLLLYCAVIVSDLHNFDSLPPLANPHRVP